MSNILIFQFLKKEKAYSEKAANVQVWEHTNTAAPYTLNWSVVWYLGISVRLSLKMQSKGMVNSGAG